MQENSNRITNESVGVDFKLEEIAKCNYYLDQMHKLYINIIEAFRQGKLVVYNPNICVRLSEQKFIEWVIKNNCDISMMFDEK